MLRGGDVVIPLVFMVWSPYGVLAEMQSSSILLVGFTALLSWEGDTIGAGGDAAPRDLRAGTALQE